MEGYTYSLTGLPKVIEKDGKFYVLNDVNVTNFATQSYTMGTENEIKSITYTEDASIVYFSELEELSTTGVATGNYSGGKGAAIKAGGISSIKTLPAGTYVATGAFCNDANNRGMYLRTSNSNSSGNVIVSIGGTYWTGEHSTREFTLNESTDIYLTGYTQGSGNSTNQSATLDYIIIRKTNVPATLGSNGYGTFASAYPLDLTSDAQTEGGFTAYKAAVDGTAVTFTALDQTVPANTGVLLKGEASATVNIPVAASGTEVTENAFLVNTAGTTFDAEAGYTYYGLIKNSSPLTFGTFAPGTVAIPANKAYLKVANTSARLDVVFDDGSATGVMDVRSKMSDVRGEGAVYDLQGRRVMTPTKGLYVVNGKKVIMK